ncbi:MAG: class I SAM-dependent rRNA methyltransferase [Pseudobdellovibrionaceae bacterium]
MSSVQMIWKLNSGADRRVRSGHPWVFSSEVSQNMHGIAASFMIELQDNKGQFVAYGYGNPKSQIIFRALSFLQSDKNFADMGFLVEKVLKAWRAKKSIGFNKSFRMCYGEADFFPGLVIDYYKVNDGKASVGQVFALQILTAGASTLIKDPSDFIKRLALQAQHEGLTQMSWDQTAVVLRNDVGVRKLEGLPIEEPNVLKSFSFDLKSILIELPNVLMSCDLQHGQKTGFFLDQTHNIFLVCEILKRKLQAWPKNLEKKICILDLCCYVGHWSSQLSAVAKNLGFEVQVDLVDVSKTALAFAADNARRAGADQVTVHELDVMEGLAAFASQSYDVVIADPPAFIKAKKDIPIGRHAYLKLNTQAFRLAKPEGLVASCSCSGLLTEEDFKETLRKAISRHVPESRCIARGGHAGDHSTLMQFPEGHYLKMFVHQA